MSKLNEVLLKQKHITQEQFDKTITTELKQKTIKDSIKTKDLNKLTKIELIALINELI